jgi:hypothetical protein
VASERLVWEDRVPRGAKLNVRKLGETVVEFRKDRLPPPKKTFRLLSFIVFALLLIPAFLVIRPISTALKERMEVLRDELLSRGEELIGRRIEYESLGPSFLGGVDIRSLKVLGKGPAPLLSASRLRVSWSLWDLLSKKGGGIRALRIDRPELYIDPQEDRDLPDIFARLKETAAQGGGGLPGVFSFRVRDGKFRLEGLGALSGVDLDAEFRDGRIDVQGDLGAELRLGGQSLIGGIAEIPALALFLEDFSKLPPANISAAGRFRLSYETGLGRGNAFLSLPFIEEEHVRITGLGINLELKERVLSLHNELPGAGVPVSAVLDYGLDTGELSFRLNCRNYSPADNVRLLGPWRAYNRFLAFRTTGEAALAYSAGGGVEYSADFSGLIPPNLPLARSAFKVKLAGDRDRVNFDRMELALTGGNRGIGAAGALNFQGRVDIGTLNPNGILSVKDLSLTGRGGINTLLTIRSRGKDINISGETLAVGDVEFTALELNLHREAGGLSFSAGALRFLEPPGETVEAGPAPVAGPSSPGPAVVRADGTFDYAPRHLETRFTLDSFSVQDLAAAALPLTADFELPYQPPPAAAWILENLLQKTRVTTEIFISTDFDQILYNAPRLVISYSGYQDLIALFSVSGTGRHFTVDGGQILWDGGNIRIAGQSEYTDTDNISFSLNAGYRDLNYFLEGTLRNRRSLTLWGSYGFEAALSAEGEGYSGRIRGESIPLPLGERMSSLDFNVSMGYLSPESWFLELTGFELAGFAAFGPDYAGLLRISGRADQNQILLQDIYLEDSLGVLRGGGAFSPTAEGEYRGNLSVFGEGHEENYTMDLVWAPKEGGGNQTEKPEGSWGLPFLKNLPEGWQSSIRDSFSFSSDSTPSTPDSVSAPQEQRWISESPGLRLRVSGAGMRLARFFHKLPNIRVDGVLDLEWESLKNFHAALSVSSLGAGSGGRQIRADGQAFVDGRGFYFEGLRLVMGDLEALVPQLYLSMDESLMEGSGRIQGKVSGSELALDFSLDSRFAPMDSWLDYAAALENLQGIITLSGITVGGQVKEEPFNFVFSRRGEGIVFSGGPDDMIYFSVKPGGAFIAAFADPFPLRGTLQGTLGFGEIDIRGERLSLNLPAVWQFAPTREDFDISSGYAVGALQIRGSLENPEFYGRFRGENLRMRVPRFLAVDIVPVDMNLVFDGSEIHFGDTIASCGSGMGVVSGDFWLEKWIPVSFALNVTVGKDRPLPFKFDLGGILAQGTASGALNIAMTDLVLNVKGDLIAQETEISLNAAEIAVSQEEALWEDISVPVIADLSITTGRKVEFLWPTREFPMLQAYADLGARANIRVNSLDRSFTFTGDVKLRGGEVFYFERSFYIRNGILAFRENQNQFDPRITIRAEARDRASNGPVTISMVVDNAPLQSLTPRFESSPALSQTEILSLLGQNFVGAAREDGSVSNPFISSSVDFLTQSQVIRRAQGALRDLLHLDMFSIRTQFIQKAAFSFIGLQEQPVDRIGWVGNYFDNTSVFIGKYIGSEMFAQAMLSLRYDENKQTFGGYTFEPDFGIELRSPLGNIRWNLVPTHPETWYLEDCSFTISWNFSF